MNEGMAAKQAARDSVSKEFSALIETARKNRDAAFELRDRIFGPSPIAPCVDKVKEESPPPFSLIYIVENGLARLSGILAETLVCLDGILAKL